MGVAGTKMQWCCSSGSQKREKTAFELVLRSAWGLSNPDKQAARSSTSCQKKAESLQGYRKQTVAKISAAETPMLEMERILKNKLSASKNWGGGGAQT